MPNKYDSFRPLDGESISKRVAKKGVLIKRFRPLDGESIYKPITSYGT